jgi:phenylacetate-CoA ligase
LDVVSLTPPWLRRAVMEPLWATLTGASILEHWHDLERTQYLSTAQLRDRQLEKLGRISEAASRHTAFYARRFAEAGLPPRLRSFEDLRKLPILTKQDFRSHWAELMSDHPPANMLEFRTGGSTGVPLILKISEETSHQRNAAARRSDCWTGWRVGEPIGAVWGNPKLPETIKEKLKHELLNPVIYLDTMALTPESVREFARQWRRERPTFLFGHAHSIYLLAEMVRELSIEDIRPRAILATSMMLLANERHVIEDVFGRRVFDRYGCEEVGLIGCECERHRGMHINLDHLIVEFLREDGGEAEPGEMGFVVVTDLINDTMPMLRYRVEDLASPLPGACECGRGLPLMDRVAGRTADFLVRADGRLVAGVSLIENTLTRFTAIQQMQIVQHDIQRITINVVPEPRFDVETRAQLQHYFEQTFPDASIEIADVKTIPRESNGKYRFAICHVPSRYGAPASKGHE